MFLPLAYTEGLMLGGMLAQELLAEGLVDASVSLLELTANNEKDFVRVIVEVLIDLRDDTAEDGIDSDDHGFPVRMLHHISRA